MVYVVLLQGKNKIQDLIGCVLNHRSGHLFWIFWRPSRSSHHWQTILLGALNIYDDNIFIPINRTCLVTPQTCLVQFASWVVTKETLDSKCRCTGNPEISVASVWTVIDSEISIHSFKWCSQAYISKSMVAAGSWIILTVDWRHTTKIKVIHCQSQI